MRYKMNKALKEIKSFAKVFTSKEYLTYCYNLAMLVGVSLDVWLKYQRCKELEEKKQKGHKIGF